ncbi:protein TolR [Planctomyces bekefii]|uniref:Protein TolR n=1 Tax=Planctomyces bekefii TaxID=1653850 RepID=A0A5C6M5R6_9PLAN|nr:protein TolR [Planctomyces bekefii]
MAFGRVGQSKSDEHEEMAEINIIPLVDVMLVLLIIFMVTAPLSIGGIKIDLPSTRAKGTNIDEDRIVLTITKTGAYYIEKIQYQEATLPASFQSLFAAREKKELYIRADQGVPYGKVMTAMSAAKLAGVTKLAMLGNQIGNAQGSKNE